MLITEIRVRATLGRGIGTPVPSSVDALAVVVAAANAFAILRFRSNVVWVVLAAGHSVCCEGR